jgi:hypothetical protein
MSRSLRCKLVSLPVLLLAFACDRRLEPFVEPADEPAPLERPVRVPGLENPVPRARMPMGPPEVPAASTGAAGAPIRGRVVVGEGVEAGGEGVLVIGAAWRRRRWRRRPWAPSARFRRAWDAMKRVWFAVRSFTAR